MYLLLNSLASIVVPGAIPVVVIFGLAERWD